MEDLFELDYEEEPKLADSCPACGHAYDEIDYEYQICHWCRHENKID
jgi:hypothetical protein